MKNNILNMKTAFENAMLFYDKLDRWMKEDGFKYSALPEEYSKRADERVIAQNAAIKKHISSTHTWAVGKERWSKKFDNWFQSPFECTVCKMGGSSCDNIDRVGNREEVIDIPTRDMHNNLIRRTCQEVLAARQEYRKKRKGSKCYQCGTYGCHLKNI